MAHAHVPKFGNWDSENVPYTAYFDNARKEKGTKMINPNDPEENPEAFAGVMMGYETGSSHQAIQPMPSQFTSDKKMPVPKYYGEDRIKNQKASHQKINHTQEGSRNDKSNKSQSSSDISSSDRSVLQANHNHVRSSQRKNQGEGNFQTPSPPAQVKIIGIQQVDEIQHQRVASVPKFGAWDETDPTSGEGFTIIFNKVKQEKHIGPSKPPQGHPVGNIYSNGQRNHGNSSSITKRCCCLFSRSDK